MTLSYEPIPPSEDGISPKKMMALMILVAVMGAGLFAIGAAISRQSNDEMYDPDNPGRLHTSRLEMTPDLWKSRHPVDDVTSPSQAPSQPNKPVQIPILKTPTLPAAPSDSTSTPPTTNPSP